MDPELPPKAPARRDEDEAAAGELVEFSCLVGEYQRRSAVT